MTSIKKGFGRLPKPAREALIALAFVSAGAAAAVGLLAAFGDPRLGMVFLLPVLFTGVTAGTRAALIAAVVSFSIYNFFLVDPIFTLQIATAEDAVTLITFVATAFVTGIASGALRDEQRKSDVRARMLALISNTNRFFLSTSDEAAVRTKLASAIAELVGAGAAVTGPGGGLHFRAGEAEAWCGGLEAELVAFAGEVAEEGGRTSTLGRFRARTADMNERLFGAAIWLRPEGRLSYVIETDHYVGMLIELANAAIVRCRKTEAARAGASELPAALAQ